MSSSGPSKKWKIIIVAAIIFSLVLLIVSKNTNCKKLSACFIVTDWNNISNRLKLLTRQEVTPKVIKKEDLADVVTQGQSPLFYASLEYDPKTGIATQLKTGKINGDAPYLFPSPAPESALKFLYKVQVSIEEGVIQNGWISASKENLSTEKGTFRFRVTTIYKKDAIVKVFLSKDKLVWTGKME